MKKLSERIKELRVEKSLTQAQLANAIGVSQAAITSWENETRQPTAQSIINLAVFFDFSSDYLLGIKDEI